MYYLLKVRMRGFSIFNGSSREIEEYTFELPEHVEVDEYVQSAREAVRFMIENGFYNSLLGSGEIVLLSITAESIGGDEEE